MSKSIKNLIEGYKQILSEAQAIDSKQHPGSEEVVLMLRGIIRKNEIRLLLDSYFEKGCYFGYLALLSQVIEEQVRDLLRMGELILKNEQRSYLPIEDLEKLTLGSLIGKLDKLLKYDSLFKSLNAFNDLRKSVIHHLIDDYSVEISNLESDVAHHHVIGTYSDISNKIFETSRRMSERLSETTYRNNPNNAYISLISKKIQDLLGLKEETIVFRFSEFLETLK